MKKLMAIGLAVATAFGLVGCGGSQSAAVSSSTESTSESQEASSTAEKEPANDTSSAEMDGTIDFEISQGINEYGDKSLMLTYTNNTNHPIVGGQFMYDLKTDLTSDEESLLSQLQKEYEVDDDDLDWAYFLASNECYTEPGETAKPASYTFVLNTIDDLAYCDLADSGTATIIYLNNDKFYTSQYDFESKTFTPASPRGNAYDWMTSEIGLTIPQIDECPRVVSTDEEDSGFVYNYNVSLDEFEEYVDRCKEAGFSTVEFDGGSNCTLANDEGVELSIYYMSNDNTMNIRFNK